MYLKVLADIILYIWEGLNQSFLRRRISKVDTMIVLLSFLNAILYNSVFADLYSSFTLRVRSRILLLTHILYHIMRPSLLPSFLREIRFRKRFHNNHIYHIYGKCCKSQTKVATQSAHLLDKCPSMYVHICLRVCECM